MPGSRSELMDTARDKTAEEAGRSAGDRLLGRYVERLRALRGAIVDDPHSNPVGQVAFEISRDIEAGRVSMDELGDLAKHLSDRAFVRRAEAIRRYSESQDMPALRARAHALVCESLMEDGKERSFESFAARWATARTGMVFTAHPTFGLSPELSEVAAGLASTDDPAERNDLLARLEGLRHAPDPDISLGTEHAAAQASVTRAQDALLAFIHTVLGIARDAYPERWAELDPRPVTVASWVGYDLDGRTDIGWADMIRLKLSERAAQLERYRSLAADIAERAGGTGLDGLLARLDEAIAGTRADVAHFSQEIDDPYTLAEAANALTDGADTRVTSVETFVRDIEAALAETADTGVQEDLVALRAFMRTFGLGTAHVHFRINAAQLHNGIRKLLGIEEDPALSSRVLVSRLNELIAEAEPYSVNFRSLMLERTTAIRQFILLAQILKHIDGDTPIRFLIAECETPFTVLTAVYFARLFGVEDRIDISPLFETPTALERGTRILEQLLDNERYLAYIRLRGRLCIQTGFSDAGRFLGQIPACLAIERLQMKFARMLGQRGIDDIELLIFDTHGESIGRGAHPASMADRLRYVLTPAVRRLFAKAGIPLKHELSFQGGDGYLHFASDRLAMAALCSLLEYDAAWADASAAVGMPPTPDQFYEDTDFSLDLFLHLQAYQEGLFNDPDYRSALGAFGTNLLFKTGSRRSIRQHESANPVDRGNPAQMRAIPHNAILQQLGYLVHVVGGFGAAVRDEQDRFVDLCARSDRATRFMVMVAHAKRLSSLNTFAAYAGIFEPGYWVNRAYAGGEPARADTFRRIADLLEGDPRFEAMMRLVHRLRDDAIDLHAMLDRLGLESGKEPGDDRLELDLLHSIRIGLIQHIFVLAAQVPRFATRNDVSPRQIMELVLSLEIPEAAAVLREVFPAAVPDTPEVELHEAATYSAEEKGGYQNLNETLIGPMVQAYDLARQIGVGISHHFMAHG